jgi:hypothetical protein
VSLRLNIDASCPPDPHHLDSHQGSASQQRTAQHDGQHNPERARCTAAGTRAAAAATARGPRLLLLLLLQNVSQGDGLGATAITSSRRCCLCVQPE